MAKRNEPDVKQSTDSNERSAPIPLADRRRMLRQVQETVKPGQVFTDWASI